MIKMKIEEQVCSFELAKKLKELGIEQKSLWYWCPCPTSSNPKYYYIYINSGYQYENIKNDLKRHKEGHKSQICSAFTVAELGEMLPDDIISRRYSKESPEISYIVRGKEEEGRLFEEKTEANARAKMVIFLIEKGYLKANKNELKDIVEIAKQIATEGHKGQKRWDGRDYITHPEAVAKLVNTPELKIVAWLHDIIEDTNITAKDLLNKGIPKNLVEMVEAISKHKGEDYFNFIMRCQYYPITRKVKIADLTHNLSDLKNESMRDKYRLARYILSVDEE